MSRRTDAVKRYRRIETVASDVLLSAAIEAKVKSKTDGLWVIKILKGCSG